MAARSPSPFSAQQLERIQSGLKYCQWAFTIPLLLAIFGLLIGRSFGISSYQYGAFSLLGILAPLLGFPLTTFFFLLAFMRLAGTRRPLPLLVTALLGTVALLYLFVKVVYLPLPKGAGVMEDFTIFLYRLLRIF